MEELLMSMKGMRVDLVSAGGGVLRGEIVKLAGGVVSMTFEDGRNGFVAADKVVAVVEVKENSSKPGFVA